MKAEIRIDEDNVMVKSNKRSITVTKNKVGNNVIHIKGLTSIVGKSPASKHYLSEDDLVKNTILGLTDGGIVDLAVALRIYVEEVLGGNLV
jgi:hypothetical protein